MLRPRHGGRAAWRSDQRRGQRDRKENAMTKRQIFVEQYVLKNKVIWLLCFSNIFLCVVRIGIDQWSTVYAFQELKLSKEVAIQGLPLFEVGALVGTLLWGWLSDLVNGRRALVACIALALIIATLGVYSTRQQPVRLSGLAICDGPSWCLVRSC
ncbi:MFS transporter [Klebsiella pneumoniae]|nr:MFS transporter [Klebsiella pneumoniae]